jgi:hypothetical protein
MTKIKKRIIWTITFIIGALLVLLFLPIIVHYIEPLTYTDTFFLNNSEFANTKFESATTERCSYRPDCKDPISFHRIKKGSGVTMGIRIYDRGTAAIDDERFEKITIWLTNRNKGEYPLAGGEIIAYYSRGGSAWQGAQCGTKIQNGKLTILKNTNENIVFKIESNIECDYYNKHRKISINGTYDAKVITWDDLTPWLGTVGTNYYSESYRR